MNVFTEKTYKYDHCYKEHACTCIKCLERYLTYSTCVYIFSKLSKGKPKCVYCIDWNGFSGK